jgi:predicted enzyme related to lactoylglutathione lyase
MNPCCYFEIPVLDLDRAVSFYSEVFGYDFEREAVDGNEMAWFPLNNAGHGASGALAKGDSYKPSIDGARIYFPVEDIDTTLRKAASLGSKVLYEKTAVPGHGFVAEITDSEGNRIALQQR